MVMYNSWPLHTRNWEHVTITLQALSLVEMVEPVQVRYTLHLRGQRSMWMQDGCKVYMDSYVASNGSWFMVTWIIFKNNLLDVDLTQLGDQSTLNVHNHWFIWFYHVWEPTWIEMHWNSIWLRARWHMTSHYTWRSVTILHDFWRCIGTAFGHFLLGSHNPMVTALGSCEVALIIQTPGSTLGIVESPW
jgi:hypothetical protein